MSFTADWLALREPVDHRSRNRRVADAVRAHFSGKSGVTVLDLGAGTGANLRATMPLLQRPQRWIMVDNDPTLLQRITATDSTIEIIREERDLATDLRSVLTGAPVSLVTASSLFDLVSAPWLEQLVGFLAERRLPLYATLIYTGTERWLPLHPADGAMLSAFLRDQRRDKGFGPALGPDAWNWLVTLLEARGYHIVIGPSDWQLTSADGPLIRALAGEIAAAAHREGGLPPEHIEDWHSARNTALGCAIGHKDVFAVPGGGR
ncbi:class I SAM-dependent methyltransferase [Rhodoligotrophos defluvii]|uniref:class I SAM-dependent methyltransferase n=1 Tax=Rhodoligotrophos defluvii TaxID=2561934 RepID=UPI0010C9C62B|nr:class I SAM-dependent methyltransferase [Rhodoligotrophos defluvii]